MDRSLDEIIGERPEPRVSDVNICFNRSSCSQVHSAEAAAEVEADAVEGEETDDHRPHEHHAGRSTLETAYER